MTRSVFAIAAITSVVAVSVVLPASATAQSYPQADPNGGVVTNPGTGSPELPSPRTGLLIAGSVTQAIPWVISVVAGAAVMGSNFSTSGILGMIPVVGPFVAMGTLPGVEGAWIAEIGYFVDGLIQVAGAAMLIPGAVRLGSDLRRNDRLRRAQPTAWNLAPGAPGTFAGMTLSVIGF